uniref:Uncharacterized protein n=1 Tax=Leersia perrieri TaxID=77586 RepID=A0A0D9WC49_9ORYZ
MAVAAGGGLLQRSAYSLALNHQHVFLFCVFPRLLRWLDAEGRPDDFSAPLPETCSTECPRSSQLTREIETG